MLKLKKPKPTTLGHAIFLISSILANLFLLYLLMKTDLSLIPAGYVIFFIILSTLVFSCTLGYIAFLRDEFLRDKFKKKRKFEKDTGKCMFCGESLNNFHTHPTSNFM